MWKFKFYFTIFKVQELIDCINCQVTVNKKYNLSHTSKQTPDLNLCPEPSRPHWVQTRIHWNLKAFIWSLSMKRLPSISSHIMELNTEKFNEFDKNLVLILVMILIIVIIMFLWRWFTYQGSYIPDKATSTYFLWNLKLKLNVVQRAVFFFKKNKSSLQHNESYYKTLSKHVKWEISFEYKLITFIHQLQLNVFIRPPVKITITHSVITMSLEKEKCVICSFF